MSSEPVVTISPASQRGTIAVTPPKPSTGGFPAWDIAGIALVVILILALIFRRRRHGGGYRGGHR